MVCYLKSAALRRPAWLEWHGRGSNNIFGLAGSLVPIGIGLFVQTFGLGLAMWMLLLGPTVLMVSIPRCAGFE